ncbi:MAG: Na-translocating system protein MpsC family protein, partial [Clostridia bacterium]|nr:Na-translocating system protein MpsC family protein [Clostridia bacterium]
LIEKIRKTGYTNPIIITSALKDVESIIKTVDLGISKYVIKPINMAELDVSLQRVANETLINHKKIFNFSLCKKKEYESDIRHIFSNILKKYTGKGPRDIKVFIGENQIDVTCLNVLTPYECTLLQEGKNTALVEQNRRLLYHIIKEEIEKTTSQSLDIPIKVKEVSINSLKQMDLIYLTTHLLTIDLHY